MSGVPGSTRWYASRSRRTELRWRRPGSFMRKLTALLLLLLATGTAPWAPAGAGATTAAAITAKVVVKGLKFPAAFTFAPTGAIWYGERFSGRIRVLAPKRHTNHVFFRIPGVVGAGEQGLLG